MKRFEFPWLFLSLLILSSWIAITSIYGHWQLWKNVISTQFIPYMRSTGISSELWVVTGLLIVAYLISIVSPRGPKP